MDYGKPKRQRTVPPPPRDDGLGTNQHSVFIVLPLLPLVQFGTSISCDGHFQLIAHRTNRIAIATFNVYRDRRIAISRILTPNTITGYGLALCAQQHHCWHICPNLR